MKKIIFSFIILFVLVSVSFALEYDPNIHNVFVEEYSECCKKCNDEWADTHNVDYSEVREMCIEECEEEYQKKMVEEMKEKFNCFIGLTR